MYMLYVYMRKWSTIVWYHFQNSYFGNCLPHSILWGIHNECCWHFQMPFIVLNVADKRMANHNQSPATPLNLLKHPNASVQCTNFLLGISRRDIPRQSQPMIYNSFFIANYYMKENREILHSTKTHSCHGGKMKRMALLHTCSIEHINFRLSSCFFSFSSSFLAQFLFESRRVFMGIVIDWRII